MGKSDRALRIDRRVVPNFADGDLPTADYIALDPTPPAPPSIPAPSNLALTTMLQRSSAAPMALIGATWDLFTNGFEADAFIVQAARDSAFANVDKSLTALDESAAIEGLQCGTTYYVRVQAMYRAVFSGWSKTTSITTPIDSTPPAGVSAISWQWLASGDLVISWTAPSSENYKDAEVRIYTSSAKTLNLRTMYGRNAVNYTAAMNNADTGGVPVAAVYIEVYARSYSNVLSPVTLPSSQPFKAKPATPTGLTSTWSGDTGTAGADLVISWSSQSDAIGWRLSIDTRTITLNATSYTYALATNSADHAGNPDPSVAISLLAVDGLGQVSATPAAAAAVNARPPAPSTVTIGEGFSLLPLTISRSTALDFKAYQIRIIKDLSTVYTARSTSETPVYSIAAYGAGSYQAAVSVIDQFEQASAELISAAVYLAPLTITELRAAAKYSDDTGRSGTTLDALKDGDTTSSGVSYA